MKTFFIGITPQIFLCVTTSGDIRTLRSVSNIHKPLQSRTTTSGDIRTLRSVSNIHKPLQSCTTTSGDIRTLRSVSNIHKPLQSCTTTSGDIRTLRSVSYIHKPLQSCTTTSGDIMTLRLVSNKHKPLHECTCTTCYIFNSPLQISFHNNKLLFLETMPYSDKPYIIVLQISYQTFEFLYRSLRNRICSPQSSDLSFPLDGKSFV
jgi:hypothetical protein